MDATTCAILEQATDLVIYIPVIGAQHVSIRPFPSGYREHKYSQLLGNEVDDRGDGAMS